MSSAKLKRASKNAKKQEQVLEAIYFGNGVVHSVATAIAKKLPCRRTRTVSINWLEWIHWDEIQDGHFEILNALKYDI